MKKNVIFYTLLFAFFAFPLTAKEVNKDTAQKIASNFLSLISNSAQFELEKIETVSDLKDDLVYIAHLHPKGFIAVSAQDEIRPVIAYSLKSDWRSASSNDDAMFKLLTVDVRNRIEYAESQTVEMRAEIEADWKRLASDRLSKLSFRQFPEEGTTSTGGWVETTWYQLHPYNKFLPVDLDEDERSATGCIVSAYSPIVDYWKSINGVQLNQEDEYVTRYLGINIDADTTKNSFPSFETLNNYLKAIDEKYKTGQSLTEDEIAAFNFALGILVEMDYSFSIGSGAYTGDAALAMTERLGFASADYINATNPDFYSTLRDNMMNGQPAVLTILQSEICSPMHAIIADGYNTMDYYHLNFGWGEVSPENISDAWYLLPKGMPSHYDVVTDGVLNIRPESRDSAHYYLSKKFIDLGGAKVNEESRVDSFSVTSGTNISDLQIKSSSNYFRISLDGENFTDTYTGITLTNSEKLDVYVKSAPDSEGVFSGYIGFSTGTGTERYSSLKLQAIGLPNDGTVVNGGKISSGTWTKENSPFYICGDVQLNHPNKLRIEPGVDVIFMGKFGMEVWGGKLTAIGTKEDSIRFTPADTSLGWLGMDIIGFGSEEDTIAYAVFSGGKADLYHPQNTGGGIKIADGSPVILNSKFENNFAGNGGALFITGAYSKPVIKNCLFVNNRSTSMGGAITVNGGFNTDLTQDVLFENVTIEGNYTTKMGGAMALYMGAKVTLRNSIVWNNTALHDGKVFDLGNDTHGITKQDSLIIEYSDIDTSETDWLLSGEVKGYINWGEGNISKDPGFDLDYSLRSSSPCIDAGDPAPSYYDIEDPLNPGFACAPASGALRNDMGVFGGGKILVTSVENNSEPVSSFRLEQNYPNPFNPKTVIRYTIPERNQTSIKIYDILGREILTLINEVKNGGSHSVNLNGINLASGIYFYRIESGKYSSVRKMTLMK